MKENPELATYINDNRYNSKLTSFSVDSIKAKKTYYKELQAKLNSATFVPKTTQEDLSFKLFKYQINSFVSLSNFNEEYMNIDHLENGPQIEIPNIMRDTRFSIEKDYTDFIARLSNLEQQIDERIELLKLGLKANITKPKITLVSVPSQFRYLTSTTAENSTFFIPFLSIPSNIPSRDQIKANAKNIIETKVYPAMNKLLNYLETDYIPNARTTIGCSDLPKGKEYYKALVEYFTTTSRTPDEIHELGLSEVSRIKKEMDQIIQNLNFQGSFQEFISSLKNDTRFYAKTEEEFLSFIRNVAKRSDPELSKLFKTLPRCTYGVRPIDKEQAKTAPAAFYNPPNSDCSRPGYYYVNTYDLTQRPLYVYESTTLHETVPGHHFQIAIANELQNLPKFRTTDSGSFTAFVEGWALYAESLGETMGFYSDPYFKFGSLGDEMLRACRLVVDTGMHWKSWTRQQAIDYMKTNTPLSELDIVSEIDRYITWPGQALAYKSGQLKITELREKAKSQLGTKFDIREFHDAVLENGSLPLDLLEQVIASYIKKSS
eukprot:gene1305-11389_t